MKSWLVDINVWLALAYDRHQHHALARQWFEEPTSARFCFCRLTQLGFLRLLINPAVMGRDVRSGREAWRLYDELAAHDRVSFVSEPEGFEREFRELTRGSRTSCTVHCRMPTSARWRVRWDIRSSRSTVFSAACRVWMHWSSTFRADKLCNFSKDTTRRALPAAGAFGLIAVRVRPPLKLRAF